MRLLTSTLITALTLLTLSCKDNVRMVDPGSDHPSGKVVLGIDNTPAEISLVTARLSRSGFHDLTLSLTISGLGRSAHGTFENVATGIWHLRVDAYDDSSVIRYTGEADVDVLPGDTTRANLELLPATGIVEIHVTWGSSLGTSGLMLYLPFDNSLQDSSGNGNNGTANTPIYTSDPWGNTNSAYVFNGENNYITIRNSPSLNPTNQMTITFWLRIDSIQSNYMDILVKGGPVYDYFANREYALYAKAGTDILWYPEWKSAGDGGGMHELDGNFHPYAIRQWNFFTFIADRINHQMQIYANGVLTHQTNDSYSSFNINSYPLLIGWSEEGLEGHSPLKGAMDNLRIYKRALTPSQILALYNSHK